jgi:metal-dependent amidase/aminoacylase/carboxypeptidase family protein
MVSTSSKQRRGAGAGCPVAGSRSAPNVIPAEVVGSGTARSYSPKVRDTIKRRQREPVEGFAGTHGCSAGVRYQGRSPPSSICRKHRVGRRGGSKDRRHAEGGPQHRFPGQRGGLFLHAGATAGRDNHDRQRNGAFNDVHTPYFDFNDRIFGVVAAYWVALVQEELKAPD